VLIHREILVLRAGKAVLSRASPSSNASALLFAGKYYHTAETEIAITADCRSAEFSAKEFARTHAGGVQIASSRGKAGFPIRLQLIATKITLIEPPIATVFLCKHDQTRRDAFVCRYAMLASCGCVKRIALCAPRDVSISRTARCGGTRPPCATSGTRRLWGNLRWRTQRFAGRCPFLRRNYMHGAPSSRGCSFVFCAFQMKMIGGRALRSANAMGLAPIK
jgi:hypothetical protein